MIGFFCPPHKVSRRSWPACHGQARCWLCSTDTSAGLLSGSAGASLCPDTCVLDFVCVYILDLHNVMLNWCTCVEASKRVYPQKRRTAASQRHQRRHSGATASLASLYCGWRTRAPAGLKQLALYAEDGLVRVSISICKVCVCVYLSAVCLALAAIPSRAAP